MEVKKHGLTQLQNGEWKLTLSIHPDDMTPDILTDPMGSRYGMALVKMEEVEEDKPKLTQRAVMMCTDSLFIQFAFENKAYSYINEDDEQACARFIRDYCDIKSRSELNANKDAGNKFLSLCNRFDQWKIEQRYQDNFSR